jgi:hypothetical protein
VAGGRRPLLAGLLSDVGVAVRPIGRKLVCLGRSWEGLVQKKSKAGIEMIGAPVPDHSLTTSRQRFAGHAASAVRGSYEVSQGLNAASL